MDKDNLHSLISQIKKKLKEEFDDKVGVTKNVEVFIDVLGRILGLESDKDEEEKSDENEGKITIKNLNKKINNIRELIQEDYKIKSLAKKSGYRAIKVPG
jgi:hypothetical protein